MFDVLHAALSQFATVSGPLGWIVLASFLIAIAADYVDRSYSQAAFVIAWVLFAAFWLSRIQPYFVEDGSFVRGIGAILGVILSVLVAKVFYEGSDALFTLSRAVAIAGVIYLPFIMITPLREQLILLVTDHTTWAMSQLGYNPPVVTELSEAGYDREISGKEYDFENTYVFPTEGGGSITFTIILACTGIGSMAVVTGLVTAVDAPWRRKFRALAIAIPIIYGLNIVRNVFIAIAYGHQHMHFFPDLTMAVFGIDNSLRVSYMWAHNIFAQVGSVIALIAIFWLIAREVPEITQPIEELLYLLTNERYDLAEALRVEDTPETSNQPAD